MMSPANDRITVPAKARDAGVRLIDASGRTALRARAIGLKQDLAVNTLSPGLRTVELLPNGSAPQRTKMLLE